MGQLIGSRDWSKTMEAVRLELRDDKGSDVEFEIKKMILDRAAHPPDGP